MQNKRKIFFFFLLPITLTVSLISFAFTDDLFEISKNLDIFSSIYRELNLYYVDETKPGQLMKTASDAMLHSLDPAEKRILNIGFASGRFPFSNIPYGIVPRSELEKVAWPALRGKILQQATEIFLRLIKGEIGGASGSRSGFSSPRAP